MTYKLDFHTSNNQFYISSDINATVGRWSEASYNDRMVAFNNIIVVFTESYGHIKGELNVLNSANTDTDYYVYDHIVEGGLKVESGIIQFLDCPFSAVQLEILLKPGNYKVRVYFLNMVGYDSDEEESDDFYKIEIWPDSNLASQVLKRLPRN